VIDRDVAFTFPENHTNVFKLLKQISEEVAGHLKKAGVEVT
jgi:hypothetical protein